MRRLRGFLTGYLALVALSALVSPGGSSRTSGLLGVLSSVVDRALSPGVPAIPDYAAGGGTGGGGGTPTTGSRHVPPNYQARRQQAGESVPPPVTRGIAPTSPSLPGHGGVAP